MFACVWLGSNASKNPEELNPSTMDKMVIIATPLQKTTKKNWKMAIGGEKIAVLVALVLIFEGQFKYRVN